MRPLYRDAMLRTQISQRLPDDLLDEARMVAWVRGVSLNQLIVDALTAEIERTRGDREFKKRAKRLMAEDRERRLAQDREMIERLAP